MINKNWRTADYKHAKIIVSKQIWGKRDVNQHILI